MDLHSTDRDGRTPYRSFGDECLPRSGASRTPPTTGDLDVYHELGRYCTARAGDAFRVRAAALAMSGLIESLPDVSKDLRSTASSLIGVQSLAVDTEWAAHLRITPWYRRGREARNEAAWRKQRHAELVAEAEAEVAAVIAEGRRAAYSPYDAAQNPGAFLAKTPR